MANSIEFSSSFKNPRVILSINLDAISTNYKILSKLIHPIESGAVIKANGYGLGAAEVAKTLAKVGCRSFFVAHLEEGIKLRKALWDHEICILNGLYSDSEQLYKDYQLLPVLGSLSEIKAWKGSDKRQPHPCCVHVDTGMLRLGLPSDEIEEIVKDKSTIDGLNIKYIMSHLATADEPSNRKNEEQLSKFLEIREIFPMGRASLSASSGIFLGKRYHFDLARPGIAIYGANPTPGRDNPMKPVITLRAQIIQIRNAKQSETVGYGGSYQITKNSQIATVALGYADGFLRSLSNKTFGYINNKKVPLVGKVSMDLATFDVTHIAKNTNLLDTWIEIIGPNHTIDEVAFEAGTISHEILTALGDRYHRIYTKTP